MKTLPELNRSSFEPLYSQLANAIAEAIRAGKLSVGTLLPSEVEWAKHYNISRMTVRQAMSKLETDGLIERSRGRGTYVKPPTLLHNISFSFEDEMEAERVHVENRILEWGTVTPPSEVAVDLQINSSTECYKLSRLRLINGVEIGIEERYFPEHIGRKIRGDLLSGSPVYKIIETTIGERIDSIVSIVESIQASSELSVLLKIAIGEPILQRKQTYFTKGCGPVVRGVVKYSGDKYSFRFVSTSDQLRLHDKTGL